ncbi:hypothetical protein GW846_04625 [Candidatus Gracilibacteria bacterium]|nr:hypothetical protein [Candidatus Gracilibacteria bacterium]
MDFKSLKNKAKALKNKAVDAGKDALEYSSSKLASSGFTLKNTTDLEAFIQKSLNSQVIDSKTGIEKKFKKRVIVIFTDTKTQFFSQMLYLFPVLSAKAYSQNVSIRLADVRMKDLQEESYQITGVSTLVVFENTEILKVIHGEENIQKVVKSLSLDINTTIDTL